MNNNNNNKNTILIILLISFGLRLIAINQSFWLDEAVQVWASQNSSLFNLISQYIPKDVHPPLYYILTWIWARIFSPQEWVIRLLPVSLALASIYLFYKILKKKFNFKNFQLYITTLLVAASPLHIYYSQENRMYILATLGFLASFYTFLNYVEKQSFKNFVFLSFSLIIMGFSHYLTLFTLPIFLIYGYKKINKKILLPFISLIIAYLVYSPILINQLRQGLIMQSRYPVWQATVGSSRLKAALLLPLKFVIGRISWQPQKLYLLTGGLLTLFFWLPALLPLKKSSVNKAKQKLVCSLLFLPPLIALLISPWISVFSYFRFLYLLPLFYLAIGLSKTILSKKIFRLLTASLLAVNLICSAVYLFNSHYHRENWRGMVNWLHQDNTQHAPVIVLSQVNKAFIYYDQQKSNTFYVSPPKKPNLSPKATDQNKIYLVSYGLPIFDPNDKIRKELKAKGLMPKTGKSFRKVGVEVWEK